MRASRILCLGLSAAAVHAQSSTNLIADPGFEAAFTTPVGTAAPGKWSVTEGITISQCPAGPRSGAQAASFTALDDGTCECFNRMMDVAQTVARASTHVAAGVCAVAPSLRYPFDDVP